jgi:hypothetical protein
MKKEREEMTAEEFQRRFEEANPASQATMRAIAAIITVIKEPEQPDGVKLDVIKNALGAYYCHGQADALQMFDEGREKFPEMPLEVLLGLMQGTYLKEAMEAHRRLTNLFRLYKCFEGVDLDAVLKAQMGG